MEDGEIIEKAEMVDEATAREEHADIEALKRGDNIMRMELMLLRREKELWEKERQLLGRELEMLRSPMMASTTSNGGIIPAPGDVRSIKDLLPEFDETDNAFWR